MLKPELLLRRVPEHLVSGVQSGQLQVFGSIIRSNSSGKIVAHLQETGRLSLIASQVPLDPVTGTMKLAIEGVQVAQNEQIKAGIQVLQTLQNIGLALNAASIGVSLAGFAMLNHKISSLQTEVSSLHDSLRSLERTINDSFAQQWERDCQRLRTLAEQLDESWFLSDGRTELADIAKEAHFLGNEFHRQAERALVSEVAYLEAIPDLEAFSLATAIRVTARLAMDENEAALETSIGCTQKIYDLVGSMMPSRAAVIELQSEADAFGTGDWERKVTRSRQSLIDPVSRLREIEASSAARGLTLQRLISEGISGRKWLEIAGSEEESPLLIWQSQD